MYIHTYIYIYIYIHTSVYAYMWAGRRTVASASGTPVTVSASTRYCHTPHPTVYTPRRAEGRCRTNVAHTRESRPDSGLGFQVKSARTFENFPTSLGSAAFSGWLPWVTSQWSPHLAPNLDLRTTTSQTCEAVPRRARI